MGFTVLESILVLLLIFILATLLIGLQKRVDEQARGIESPVTSDAQ